MPESLTIAQKAAMLDDIVILPEEDWQRPIALAGEEKPPVFPVSCLPDTLKNYVEAVAENTQTPADMAAICALCVIAACVQGKFMVEPKPGWREPLSLYALIIGDPGERKSPVVRAMVAPIQDYEAEANQRLKYQIERDRLDKKLLQKEVDRLANAAAEDDKWKAALYLAQDKLTAWQDIKPLRLLADDVTTEALGALMVANGGKMAIISAESGIFGMLQGRYNKETSLDLWLKGHDGDFVTIDRKGAEPESIKSPALTVCLAAQPQVIDNVMKNEALRGRGFLARFLYAAPASLLGRRVYDTAPIPQEVEGKYAALCKELLRLESAEEPQIIALAPEAAEDMRLYFYDLETGFAPNAEEFDDMRDWAAKIHGRTARIAGLLHLAQLGGWADKKPISRETVQAAIIIGSYFIEHAKAIFKGSGTDTATEGARYMLKKLRKCPSKQISRRDLLRLCQGKYKTAEALEPVIDLLLDYRYLRIIPQPSSKGRPSTIYEISPYL